MRDYRIATGFVGSFCLLLAIDLLVNEDSGASLGLRMLLDRNASHQSVSLHAHSSFECTNRALSGTSKPHIRPLYVHPDFHRCVLGSWVSFLSVRSLGRSELT